MHTNVDIDEELIAEAMRQSGLSTKRAVVEAGLRALLTLRSQEEVRDLRGRLHWGGKDEEAPSAASAASAAKKAKRKPARKGQSGARPR
jgi:Arc/MetJ family transcription regulator